MVYTAAILLFILAAASVYALIVSKTNYLILFILTPLLLISSIYSAYTLYSLQGTPINGIPKGEVEIVWIELANPDILFLARSAETGGTPFYYRIPYTQENLQQLNGVSERLENGITSHGIFESFSDSEDNIRFTPPPSEPERQK